MIHVALVEDDLDTRLAIRQCLLGSDSLTLVAEADNYDDAATLIEARGFEVLLLDIDLHSRLSLPLIEAACQFSKVVVLTVLADEQTVLNAIALGAAGYVLKSDDADLEAVINGILLGHAPLSPSIARYLVQQIRRKPDSSIVPAKDLSAREVEVLSLLARGKSYQQVADHCGISHSTVAFHVRQIYEKLRVHSKSEAVYAGLQAGVIRL